MKDLENTNFSMGLRRSKRLLGENSNSKSNSKKSSKLSQNSKLKIKSAIKSCKVNSDFSFQEEGEDISEEDAENTVQAKKPPKANLSNAKKTVPKSLSKASKSPVKDDTTISKSPTSSINFSKRGISPLENDNFDVKKV